ncbi:CGNR zinc finger domain-containing protein [Planomonospora parontospora]|uniref:CGNR zinc finger domain-containing protein n=1 Tax=Planomonospora parontospora TaxID=58119 RepID=UPI001EF55D30|nr:CGNR zinc finger domain-containing protein [Planomonospora parontospora]
MVTDQGRHSPLSPPEAADLVLDFVNTRPIGGREERLADAPAAARWLRAAGLAHEGTLVTEADAAAARELRQALVTVLLAHAGEHAGGGPGDGGPGGGGPGGGTTLEEAEAHLRRSGALYPLSPVVTAHDVRLVPAHGGVPGAFGGLLAAVAELARGGLWARVKACRNPPCHLGFYDRTRNCSAAYCSPKRCGAQVAMRSYRSRRAADPAGAARE